MSYTVQTLETEHNGYKDWPVFAVRSEQNHCLAVVGAVDRATSGQNEANARLFAAAPDMLAACELALESFGCVRPEAYAQASRREFDTLKAAITKAKGQL